MQQIKSKTTLIRISNETYDDLVALGSFSDSFDTIIQKLLKRRKK